MLKKRTKRVTQNRSKGRKTLTRKKVYSKSRNIVKKENSLSSHSSIYASFMILLGLISLSISIFLLIRQLQPVIKNEKLKFLWIYQLIDKKTKI